MENVQNANNVNNDQNNQGTNPNPQPPAKEPEKVISAKEAFGGVGRWTKQTAKKVWRKAKKPLAVAGGCLAVAGLTLTGMELAQQNRPSELPPSDMPQAPEPPVVDAEFTVTDPATDETEVTTE